MTKQPIMFTAETRAKAAATRQLADDPAAILAASGLDLTEKRKAAVLARLREMPASYRGTFLRSQKAKPNPKTAIRAFCQMCFGWSNVKPEVQGCTSTACPLYTLRPYQD